MRIYLSIRFIYFSLPLFTQLEKTFAAWRERLKRESADAKADNGAISPVIQSTNQSRVPSSRPRTDVRPKGKDTRSNAEHNVEWKR